MYLLGEGLLHFPDVVGLEEFGEVVVLLLCLEVFYLLVDGIVVGRCVNVADNAEGDREAITIAHDARRSAAGISRVAGEGGQD